MTAVAVDLSVDIDLDAWAFEYHLDDGADVRADIRTAVAMLVQEHLRTILGGFDAATVRIKNTPYRPARMRS